MGTCVVRWVVGLAIVVAASAASAAPELRPGSAVSADVVRCRYDCWLARLLLPSGWIEPKRQIELLGVTGGTVTLGDPIAIATSQLTGDMLDQKAISFGVGPINAGTAAVPVTIDKSKLSPNHYVGIVRVSAPDGSGAIDVPVDLRVRSGPGWPLVVLLAGILIGWVAKWRKEKGEKIERVVKALERLTTSVQYDSAPARAVLTPMLDRAEDALFRDAIDEVDAFVTKIAERRVLLAALDRLARSLPGNKDIVRARDMVARERDDKAKELIAKLEDLADAGAEESFGPSAAAVRRPEKPRRTPPRSRWQRWKLWFLVHALGPMLRVLLLFLLALLGLKELYIDGGADFGAQPLYDHLALFFWGLGSEIASRGLDGLGSLLGGRTGTAAAAPAPDAGEEGGDEAEAPPAGGEEVSLPEHEIEELPGDETLGPTTAVTPWQQNDLHLAELVQAGADGDGVTIGVIDSGVHSKQSNLDWKRIVTKDTNPNGNGGDFHGHGTTMVGLLASRFGICPKATVISIKALDSNGTGTAADLVRGIELALSQGCDVISISAGQANPDGALEAAVKHARDRGVVVVGAIRKESPTKKSYPAASDGCIGVSHYDESRKLVHPNPPDWVACAGPGVAVRTFGRQGEASITGASAATALVAGVCAHLLSTRTGDARRALGRKLAAIVKATASTGGGGRRIEPLAALEKVKQEP